MIELPPKIDFWLPPKPAIIRPSTDIKRASFMPGMFPAGAVAAGATILPPELVYLQSAEDGANLTTYTFASQNIGAEAATRRVVAVCYWSSSVTARNLSSVTIGGVAATVHIQAVTSAVSGGAAIVSLLGVSGTTATIVFTLNGECTRGAVAVYRAVNETSAAPHAIAQDTSPSSGFLTTTINIPTGGWVVASVAYGVTAGNSFTWAGATERYDGTYAEAAGVYRTGASEGGLAAQTGRTISAQCSTGTEANGSLVAMSWG